jgi:CO/xanthine dehydrogenase Mo-binding subunit
LSLCFALAQATVSHANIKSIDTSAAEAMPGVFKILTEVHRMSILPATLKKAKRLGLPLKMLHMLFRLVRKAGKQGQTEI